ncbi:hypothetical protein [Streptomyces carpaticus]|uniref:Uncharacterized protein n=1 Tax=Streptomyces carpaticus TaxID=285558 RepID=A0ABV4ZRU3_9ACTN
MSARENAWSTQSGPQGEGGSAVPDLSVDPSALNGIAADARELRIGLSATAGLATSASLSAAGDLRAADLASAGSLTVMVNHFFRKSMDLVADCQTIEDGLGFSATSHTEMEADAVAQLHRANPAILDLEPGASVIAGTRGTSGGHDARI